MVAVLGVSVVRIVPATRFQPREMAGQQDRLACGLYGCVHQVHNVMVRITHRVRIRSQVCEQVPPTSQHPLVRCVRIGSGRQYIVDTCYRGTVVGIGTVHSLEPPQFVQLIEPPTAQLLHHVYSLVNEGLYGSVVRGARVFGTERLDHPHGQDNCRMNRVWHTVFQPVIHLHKRPRLSRQQSLPRPTHLLQRANDSCDGVLLVGRPRHQMVTQALHRIV